MFEQILEGQRFTVGYGFGDGEGASDEREGEGYGSAGTCHFNSDGCGDGNHITGNGSSAGYYRYPSWNKGFKLV